MLEQLFFRSDALTRQLSAPLVGERRQYLLQCASQGMARRAHSARESSTSIVNHGVPEIG